MRKIILDLAVTLDGFIEGANGEIDWCIMDDDMDFNGFLAGIDTIFYGRVSYDRWGQYEPGNKAPLTERNIWQAIHSKDKYVFSRTRKEDNKAIYINSDITGKINEIKSKPGKNIWLYGGANLITTFIDWGLIDEYRLAIHPVILGKGKPIFANIANKVSLKLKQAIAYKSGVTVLCYEQA